MGSGYKISWTNEAKRDLSLIINYLETNWSEREIRRFFQRLEQTLETILQSPQLYKLVDKRKNVRKCLLSKQTSIYFKVEDDKIFLITLFDNRQDPKKLKI